MTGVSAIHAAMEKFSMKLKEAISLVSIMASVNRDGTLTIAGEEYTRFPLKILVEGQWFDFSEEEVESHGDAVLGHYFRRDFREENTPCDDSAESCN